MNKDRILRDLEKNEFAKNNGKIMRVINVLKGNYVNLDDIFKAIRTIDIDKFRQSIEYLQKAQYIEVRDVDSKEALDIDKVFLKYSETTPTAKGMRLLMYIEKDEAVEI